jgi:hypothetical protein
MNFQNNRRTTTVLSFALIPLLLWSTGCAAVMAARQPPRKDMAVLHTGSPRNAVIAELGVPRSSEERNGDKVDLYVFTQGYTTETKVMRVMWHATADFFTLFVWEVVGMPIEMIASGEEKKFEVVYDQNDNVKSATELGDG